MWVRSCQPRAAAAANAIRGAASLARRALPLLALLLAAPAAFAQDCRIALTLALDVSSPVDADEYRLQVEGVAQALEDEFVRAAVFQVPGVTVALQVFEWSGEFEQQIIVDWTTVQAEADLDRIAATLRAHPRAFLGGSTAIGDALIFAREQLRRAPACGLQKIDVSGDGQSNVGILPQDVYWEHDFRGVTVNGLAIEASAAMLSVYYRNFVIHGADSFVIQIRDYPDYAEAIRNKIVRELELSGFTVLLPDVSANPATRHN
jgi:hypothetical protein